VNHQFQGWWAARLSGHQVASLLVGLAMLPATLSAGEPRVSLEAKSARPPESPVVDLSKLPKTEEELSRGIAFEPRAGRFVLKVKRGWEGSLVFDHKLGETNWRVAESTNVGSTKINQDREIFCAADPTLDVVSFGDFCRFAARRTGTATLQYTGYHDSKILRCELQVEVVMDTSEFDGVIRAVFPDSRVKVTEIRSMALLSGTVPNAREEDLITAVAQQFYPQVISNLKVGVSDHAGPSDARLVPVPDPDSVEPAGESAWRTIPHDDTGHKAPQSEAVRRDSIPGDVVPTPWVTDSKEREVSVARRRKKMLQTENAELQALRADVNSLRDEFRRFSDLMATKQNPRYFNIPLVTKPTPRENPALLKDGLIVFEAAWCGPCQQMKPILERLKREGYPIQTIDVDNEPLLTRLFDVTSIPHCVVVSNGKIEARSQGLTSDSKLKSLLGEHGVRKAPDSVEKFEVPAVPTPDVDDEETVPN